MTTVQVFSDTDYSADTLPGVSGFVLYGVQLILTASQFDGLQISQQVNFQSLSPETYNEVYITMGDAHLIDARQWTFTNWGYSDTEEAGNHLLLEDGMGDDVIYGSSQNDFILSVGGNDVIKAGAGHDLVGIHSGGGTTTVHGGAGIDFLDVAMRDATVNLTVDISDGGGSRDIGSGLTIASFERLIFAAGSGDDRLTGRALDDELRGSDGKDILNGKGGADWLEGGAGADVLIGGSGNDMFTFSFTAESNRDTGIDVIRGVEAGDMIDLTGIDAVEGVGGSAFTFIGAEEFSGAAGELRVSARGERFIISGDTDGDKIADLTIVVTQTAALAEANFFL